MGVVGHAIDRCITSLISIRVEVSPEVITDTHLESYLHSCGISYASWLAEILLVRLEMKVARHH